MPVFEILAAGFIAGTVPINCTGVKRFLSISSAVTEIVLQAITTAFGCHFSIIIETDFAAHSDISSGDFSP